MRKTQSLLYVICGLFGTKIYIIPE